VAPATECGKPMSRPRFWRNAIGALLCAGQPVVAYAQVPTKLISVRRLSAETHDLSSLSAVAIGPNGTVVVTQGQDRSLRFFSKDLKPLKSVGRSGEGPGEFQSLKSVVWSGQKLLVMDARLARISEFSQTGAYVGSVPFALALLPGAHAEYRQLSPQRVVGPSEILSLAVLGTRGAFSLWVIVSDASGTFLRTVAAVPADRCELEGPSVSVMMPYCPRALVGYSHSGVRIATGSLEKTSGTTGEFRVKTYFSSGSADLSVSIKVPLERVPRSISDSVVKALYARVPQAQSLLRGKRIPGSYPPVRELVVGEDGAVWLRVYETTAKGSMWWLVTPTGKVGATIRLPEDARLVSGDATSVTTIESDTEGLESLVWYRLATR